MSGPGQLSLSNGAVEAQLVSLLERLEEREGASQEPNNSGRNQTMMAEVRTLELWRAVIAECLATVFYVFLVCGSYSPWVGITVAQEPEARIVVALVAGFAMAILVHSFGQVSGGHINPAVSIGFAITRKVSPLRATMFILAQLGGGIAGAALLYGATSSGYTGDLGATDLSGAITVWQGFGVEFLLTLVVVFVVFASFSPYRRSNVAKGSPAVAVGLAYLTCTLVGFPLTGAAMNPARSLGPAFVMNKWNSHWIYWVAPVLGGVTASLIYEYIFNPHRIAPSRKDSVDGGQPREVLAFPPDPSAERKVVSYTLKIDSSSVGSDEDAYDACSKPPRYNFNALRTQHYDQYRPASTTTHSPLGYSRSVYGHAGSASMYNAPAYKLTETGFRKDDIYSGSKSLYTKSPPLPRSTSLNRSQSVYTRPTPPRTDSYCRNFAQSQNLAAKSPSSFTGLLQETSPNAFPKNNTRQESLYVTSKQGLVKPEPVYGVSVNNYPKHPDSGDSTYSTYRGSGSYSSSRSSGGVPPPQGPPPVPVSRNHRSESHTPNSVVSGHSFASYHSPNPQY